MCCLKLQVNIVTRPNISNYHWKKTEKILNINSVADSALDIKPMDELIFFFWCNNNYCWEHY